MQLFPSTRLIALSRVSAGVYKQRQQCDSLAPTGRTRRRLPSDGGCCTLALLPRYRFYDVVARHALYRG